MSIASDEFVLKILGARDGLFLGVVNVDIIVESLLYNNVDIFIDGTVKYPSPVFSVVVREIGPAA